ISRQCNVANNHLYVRALKEKKVPAAAESLSRSARVNEYILTTLRTDAGCDLAVLKRDFEHDLLHVHNAYLRELQRHNLVDLRDQHLRLTDAGRLLADKIASDLFLIA